MKLRTLLFFLVLFLQTSFAQNENDKEHLIQSEAFEKERKVYVYLPDRYLQQPNDTFMVVYVLDAQSPQYWNLAKSILAYLVNNRKVVPMIAVGIHSDSRHKEFIPQPKDWEENYNNNGTAHLLQQHLKEEVFPIIEEEYRVNPIRAIVGHSRGGAFISHTLFSENADLFKAYIGISPAMGYMNYQILKDAETELQEREIFQKFLYCSHGDVGSYEAIFSEHVAHLDSLIQKYPNASLDWQTESFPNTDHWSVVAPSWNNGLLSMSRHFSVDQKILEDFAKNKGQSMKAQIDHFYVEKEAQFGYSIFPDVATINYYGNEFDELEYHDRALEIYQWALSFDPQNVNTSQNIAWVYRQKEEFSAAKSWYQKALEFLQKQEGNYTPLRFARLKEGLEENIQKMEEAGR